MDYSENRIHFRPFCLTRDEEEPGLTTETQAQTEPHILPAVDPHRLLSD